MDPRKDLARLVDASCGAGAQSIQRAAAGAVDCGEPEDVDRDTTTTPKLEPALLGGDAAAAALAGRQQRGGFVDPPAAAVAIDRGRRQITEPGQSRGRRDIVTMD